MQNDVFTYLRLFQSALGLELWSMTDEIVFDNFIITDDKQLHETWVEQTWVKKSTAEAQSTGGVSTLYREYIDLPKMGIEKPVKFRK